MYYIYSLLSISGTSTGPKNWFHLFISERLEKWNLNEIEKKVHSITSLIPKISGELGIFEYCYQKQGDGSFYFFIDSNRIFAFEKNFFFK